MEEVCKNVFYINIINRNVTSISKVQLKEALRIIKKSTLIIPVAEGRSQSALYSGIKGMKKLIITMNEPGFRWRNLSEALPDLENECEAIVLLVSSGSGDTFTPKTMVDTVVEYVKSKRSEKFSIVAVGSYLNSSIGSRVGEFKKEGFDGVFITLKGRDKELVKRGEADVFNEKKYYLHHGILGDVYELSSLVFFEKIKEAVNNDSDSDWVLEEIKNEMGEIGRIVDEYVSSEPYKNLVEKIVTQSRIVFGGLGPALKVAEMTAIRVRHVKTGVTQGEASVSVSGPFVSRPSPGDVFVAVSWSGETESVIQWARDYIKNKGSVFSIVGKESTLSKETESFIIKSSPDQFYTRAAFALSSLSVGVVDEFPGDIPEYLFKRSHTRTE